MSPYKSKAQAAKFHILEKQGKISHKVVAEWDKASKGLKLPRKVSQHKKLAMHKGMEDLKRARRRQGA